MARFILIFYL